MENGSNCTGNGVAPKFRVAFDAKFVPFASRVIGNRPPATTEVGEIEFSVGVGYVPTLTVKFTGAAGPKLGAGFATVTPYAPGKRMAEAGTGAVICVEVTTLVVNAVEAPKGVSANVVVAPERNCEPLMVSVKPGSPELAVVGEIEVTTGVGFKPLL